MDGTTRLSVKMWRWLKSPILWIVVFVFVVLGRAVLPGNVLSSADILYVVHPWNSLAKVEPQNRLFTDPAFQFEPWMIYAAREIHHGHFPLWNPHAFAGAPLLGNAQSAVLFPFNWLSYILPVSSALGWEAILKLLTAGLGMYWMLRVLEVGAIGATAGAVAFMFNSFFMVWLLWPLPSVGIWLPLLVGLTERLRQTLAWKYTGYLAADRGAAVFGRAS